jgi:lipopolysaccharide export system permease protein
MRLISRHILRTLAAPFFWGLAALTGLLLLNALPPLIDKFGGKGLAVSVMLKAVLLLLPALLALTLPMAVLVSVLYGYSQLAAALEMVAMYANGISVWRMARPALVGAAVVAVINFLVFDQLLPRSNVRLANLQQAAMNKSPTLALQPQVLNNLPAPSGYVLRANRIDAVTNTMYDVTIFDLSAYDERRLIVADSGTMAESTNGRDLILTLRDGEIYAYRRDEPSRLQQTNFVSNRVVVRDVQNQLDVSNTRLNRGEREKSSCELLDGVDEQRWMAQYDRSEGEYLTRRDLHAMVGLPPVKPPATTAPPPRLAHCSTYRRLGHWLSHVLLPASAAAQTPMPPRRPAQPMPQLPVAVPGRLPGPVPPQVLNPTQFLVPPGGIRPAGLTSFAEVRGNEAEVDQAVRTMRLYQVEYHQKFAVPLSAFCFVLIGIALALKYPSTGIGLVIGGSLVIFLSFYIMLQGGKGLAWAGEVNPAIALYTPLALFTIIGLLAVSAANRQMGSARSVGIVASIGEFVRGLRHRE